MRWTLCLAIVSIPVAVIVGIILFDHPRKHTGPYVREALDSELQQTKTENYAGSGNMFDGIASFYDIANRIMSVGQDMSWRRVLVDDCLQIMEGDAVLDLATGTADVALLAATKVGSSGSVLGIDPSVKMLRIGQEKVDKSKLPIRLHVGDAQDLTTVTPLSDTVEGNLQGVSNKTIDKISMAFGIRNIDDRFRALQEMRRVLKDHRTSRVCILEFSLPDPNDGILQSLATSFVERAVPLFGYVASLGKGSAEYDGLARSIKNFPSSDVFAAIMTRAGFKVESVTHMAHGVVQLYSATLR